MKHECEEKLKSAQGFQGLRASADSRARVPCPAEEPTASSLLVSARSLKEKFNTEKFSRTSRKTEIFCGEMKSCRRQR